MRRLLLLLCLITISITPSFAQDEEPEGWPIIEHCVGEPTTPPDDWSYNGMIVYRDANGVHALRDTLDTPYYLAFRNTRQFTDSAGLSPNGTLIAVPASNIAYDTTVREYRWWHVDAILIYSTGLDRQLLYRIPWHFVYSGVGQAGNEGEFTWISEELFAAESGYHTVDSILQIYDLNTGTVTHEYRYYTELAATLTDSAISFLRITVADTNNNRIQYQEYAITTTNMGFILTNSEYLPDYKNAQFELYNPDTDETVLITPASQFESLSLGELSNNGRYFTFTASLITTDDTIQANHLYIADLQEEVIHDTCLLRGRAKWSPDSRYLIYTDESLPEDEQGIFIVDWQQATSYLLHNTTGRIMGWYPG